MKAIRTAFLNLIFDSITPQESETAKLSRERPRAIAVIVIRSMTGLMDAKIVIFVIFTTLFQGMRIVVQRVKRASVTIDGKVHSSIGKGLLVLAGFEDADTAEDINWMAAKMVNLRLFDDSIGVMNLSAVETGSG